MRFLRPFLLFENHPLENSSSASLPGSLLSIIGDLTFSLIKRSCKVKDYGHIIPGHGGLLDRCDSIIMVAPFIYLFAVYFPLLHV